MGSTERVAGGQRRSGQAQHRRVGSDASRTPQRNHKFRTERGHSLTDERVKGLDKNQYQEFITKYDEEIQDSGVGGVARAFQGRRP